MRLIAALLFLAGTAVAGEPQILPVDQVREGMKGHGYSVFKGEHIEQFDFTVRSIIPHFDGWPQVIVIGITGGPKDEQGRFILDQHHIFGGMSGSPMCVTDESSGECRLIGGLAMAKNFATTSKALVTPIQYQFDMGRGLPPSGGKSAAEPGSYIAVCMLTGDGQNCGFSTVTARKDGYLYTTSHSSGLPFGATSLPAYSVPVAELFEGQESSEKLSGKLGRPVGTVVYHGAYGFIIREGELPSTVPVRLTVHDVFPEPEVRNYPMSYHHAATGALRGTVLAQLSQLVDNRAHTGVTVTMRMRNPAYTTSFTDSQGNAMAAVEALLDRLIDQEGDALAIDGIDLEFHVLKDRDLWTVASYGMSDKGARGRVSIVAKRERDMQVSQMEGWLDVTPLKPYRKRKLEWQTGTALQAKILERMPVRKALPLLDLIRVREALYLTWTEPGKGAGAPAPGVASTGPAIVILAVAPFPGIRFTSGADDALLAFFR